MFTSLLKAAAAVVTVPVSAAADVITIGGALTDAPQSYTAKALEDLMQNLDDATQPESEKRE
jgi:hypothetical protein